MSRLEDAGLNRNEKIIKISKKEPVFCFENESIMECVEKILTKNFRRIPVVDKKYKLLGILTITDILDAFLKREDFEKEISEIMVREVIYCFEDESIGDVLLKFKISRRGGFPIVDRKMRLVGIVSERDYVRRFENVKFNIKVEEVMTRKPFIVESNISILDCLRSMVNTKYRRLPVLENGKLIGIVTSADLLKYIHENNYKIEALDEDLEGICRKEVYSIKKDVDLSEAIKVMDEKDVGGLLVKEGSKVEGIITERDILERIE